MSIRRMMLFTLGGFFKSIISLFKTRVLSDGGNFEAETNLENQLNTLGSALFDSASLVITSNGVKTSKLYSIKPNDGTGDLSVIRATTATRVNEQGLIETVPYNILSYSEDFSNSYWVKTNYTVVPNSGISPIGTMTASLIVPSILGTDLRNTTVNGIGGETYIWSCYIKSNGLRYVALTAWNGDDPVTNFDLQNGVVVSQSGPQSTAKITNVGNGWYLCEVSRVLRKDYLGIWLRIGTTPLNGSNLNGSNGYLIWGAQVVRSNEPKPYQLTTDLLNVPRIDYTNGSPAILVEPQRTNLLQRSEEFENSYWQKGGFNITPNDTLSPSGTLSADKFQISSNTPVMFTTFTTLTSPITFSFYIKKGNSSTSANKIAIRNNTSGKVAAASINTDTGEITILTNTLNALFSSVKMSNGWYRFICTVNSNIVNGDGIYIYVGGLGSIAPNDIVGNYSYIWGAQLEAGSNATSYIPTTTTTVTRNADVISNINAETLIGQTEGTIFIDYNKVLANDTFRNIISLSDSTGKDLIEIWDGVGSGNLGKIIYTYFANNIVKSSENGQGSVSPSGRYKICLTYIITPSLVNVKFFINGVKLDDRNFTYTAFSNPLSRINIGNRNGIGVGIGSHNLDFILKTRITDAQAIQLTTL